MFLGFESLNTVLTLNWIDRLIPILWAYICNSPAKKEENKAWTKEDAKEKEDDQDDFDDYDEYDDHDDHDDHDNPPAKEEKNEAQAKDDAREKKEGEKNR